MSAAGTTKGNSLNQSPGDDLLPRFGRRLRVGMVGGGLDSIIGQTHLLALRMDGYFEISAGAMSIDRAVAMASGQALLLDKDRIYTDWQVMAEQESSRADGIDVAVIATPPASHAEIAQAFLRAGIDVICEKPMTISLAQADDVVEAVENSRRAFMLTHCYTGYPMVREAKALVAAGCVGSVKLVEGLFASGEPGLLNDPADSANRHWRFKSEATGAHRASVLLEIGTHLHNVAEFVSGISVKDVSAGLTTVAPRRDVYDNAYLTVGFEGGAQGRLWSSYVAAGREHGLELHIYGDEGSLHWKQESPEYLWRLAPGLPAERVSRALDGTSVISRAATRVRPGHPEGYLAAFANLYRDYARGLLARSLGDDTAATYLSNLPDARAGRRTMALIDAACTSDTENGARVELRI